MGIGKLLQSLTFQDRRLESGRTMHSNKNVQRTYTYRIWDGGSLREPYAHLGSCLSESSIMEAPVDEQCITMEDLGPIQPKFPDEQRCMQIKSVAKEIKIFSIRKDYVAKMLEVEESDPSNNKEKQK
ncbi:hypothetical protein TNCV_4054811 [Trichonephila clavipes]|nr:hypothetical protein TNCV_4054811 [Trichonephila clavipes]